MSKPGRQRFFVLWSASEYGKRRPEVLTWGLPDGELMCVFTHEKDAGAFALKCGGRVVQMLRFRDVRPYSLVPVSAREWLQELRLSVTLREVQEPDPQGC
jgi:hypothetical protein